MDIYQVIANFNEERLQKQLQLSIERAMRKGSVRYKEGQHLINLSVINGDSRPGSAPVQSSPRKAVPPEAQGQRLAVRDISKSIDSGVCVDARDTTEEDSDYEYDEVPSSVDDTLDDYGESGGGQDPCSSLRLSEDRSSTRERDDRKCERHSMRHSFRRQTSYTGTASAVPSQMASSNFSMKTKSLNRRHKGKEGFQKFSSRPEPNDYNSGDLMTRSVMDSLDPEWTEPVEQNSPFRRTGSKDTLLNPGMRRAGSREVVLQSYDPRSRRVGSNDDILSCHPDFGGTRPRDRNQSCGPAEGYHSLPPDLLGSDAGGVHPCKNFCPEPGADGGKPPSAGGNKGVLLLELRKGDIVAVVEGGSAGVSWWGMLSLRTGCVGYVHKNFLKFVERRRSTWLVGGGQKSSRAVHMRSLAELQQAAAMHTHPDVVYGAMIPDPDYSDDDLESLAASKLAAINNSINNNKNCNNSIFSNSNKSRSLSSSSPPATLPPAAAAPLPSPPAAVSNTAPLTSAAAVPANMVLRNNRVNSAGDESEAPLPPKPVSPHPPQKENKNGRFDENGLVLPKKLLNPSLDSTEKKSLHRELLFNQKVGVNVLNQKTELQRAMEKHKDKQIAKEQQKEKQANLTPFQKALEQQALKLEQVGTEKTDETKKGTEAELEFQKLQAKLRSKLEAQ